MGRMVFNIIPREGKPGVWLGEAAKYDFSGVGRYELYINDYATDVCEGETQTACRAWCEDVSALLITLAAMPELELGSDFTLGELQSAMSNRISDMDEFLTLCNETGVSYEKLPLFIERHD